MHTYGLCLVKRFFKHIFYKLSKYTPYFLYNIEYLNNYVSK